VINLIIFIFVTMAAFVIIGMTIFGRKLEDPRANFGTFSRGMLTLAQVMTGDKWSSIMYRVSMCPCFCSCVRVERACVCTADQHTNT
jgi:hypothetical protein